MLLLLAAGGLFSLLCGLTLIVIQIIVLREDRTGMIWAPFLAFFLVGVTLLVAATFLRIGDAIDLLKFPFGQQRGQR